MSSLGGRGGDRSDTAAASMIFRLSLLWVDQRHSKRLPRRLAYEKVRILGAPERIIADIKS
jgi:hypothetical protein